MDTYQATNKIAAVMPAANVQETTTPHKRTVDLDALPPAREDGPRPIPRRFVGRTYESLHSGGQKGDGMTAAKSAETYGVARIHITRNIIGVGGEFWFVGDEIEGVPVNLACELVSNKSAEFDASEFKSEGEIETLEKLGYHVEPPMLKARDRPEFADVIARKKNPKSWVGSVIHAGPLDP